MIETNQNDEKPEPPEDWIQLTKYKHNVSTNNVSVKLISKIENQINNDLTHINSVYENQIKDLEIQKIQMITNIEKEFEIKKSSINLERNKEITKYSLNTEKKLSNIISNLNSTDNTRIVGYSLYQIICSLIFK